MYEYLDIKDAKIGDTVERQDSSFNCKEITAGNLYIIKNIDPPNNMTVIGNFKEDYKGNSQLFKLIKRNKMTKSDLKTGMIVETREGERGFVLLDNASNGYKYSIVWSNFDNSSLMSYDENLTHCKYESDIQYIYTPRNPCHMLSFKTLDNCEILWKREEAEEMTLQEVCKQLGKEIKIIK